MGVCQVNQHLARSRLAVEKVSWQTQKRRLTGLKDHDRICPAWARSSTAEQWPFKPLAEGSSPSALIFLFNEEAQV